MSKWKIVKLEDIAQVAAGQGAPQGEDKYCDNGTPFIKAGNLEYLVNDGIESATQKVNEEIAKSHKLKLFKAGTVIFAKSGMSCMKGYVYTLKNDCYVVNHLACVTPRSVLSDYLKYYFSIHRPNSLIKDSSYPSISLSDISSIEIPLPPLEAQKHIAKTLDAASELLAMRKQQLAELDALIKSVFYDMFGDPVRNEKRWNISFFNDVFDIIDGDRGVNYPKQDDFFDEGYCLFLNTGNVTKDGFDFTKISFISEEKDRQLRKGRADRGDIILTTRGTVGNIVHYNESIPYNVIRINSGMVLLRSINNKVLPTYFCEMFKSNEMSREIKSYMSGTAQPQLPITNIKKIKFIVPPLTLQTRFTKVVTIIEEQKALVQKAIDETQLLFDSLMSQYYD